MSGRGRPPQCPTVCFEAAVLPPPRLSVGPGEDGRETTDNVLIFFRSLAFFNQPAGPRFFSGAYSRYLNCLNLSRSFSSTLLSEGIAVLVSTRAASPVFRPAILH